MSSPKPRIGTISLNSRTHPVSTFQPDSTGTENNSEPYSDFLSYLLSLPDSKLPSVVTMSYGDTEQTVPKSYAHKVCNQISALVARRVTVISSSGDFGVGVTGPNGTCTSNGNGPVKEGVERFRPSFPCTCPWVTCIGATENVSRTEVNNSKQSQKLEEDSREGVIEVEGRTEGSVNTYEDSVVPSLNQNYFSIFRLVCSREGRLDGSSRILWR